MQTVLLQAKEREKQKKKREDLKEHINEMLKKGVPDESLASLRKHLWEEENAAILGPIKAKANLQLSRMDRLKKAQKAQ